MDPNLLLGESLAQALYRPIIILTTLDRHRIQPVIQFNHNSVRPPLIYGLHQVGEHKIFTPYFLNKEMEFRLDDLKNKIEIVAYMAKTVPEDFKSRSTVLWI